MNLSFLGDTSSQIFIVYCASMYLRTKVDHPDQCPSGLLLSCIVTFLSRFLIEFAVVEMDQKAKEKHMVSTCHTIQEIGVLVQLIEELLHNLGVDQPSKLCYQLKVFKLI